MLEMAIIEASNRFRKNLMKKYNIPTAKYEVFSSSLDALEYLKQNKILHIEHHTA